MTREEIENRIMICELRANEYREVGNTKTASRYDNEKHKWEKLLSDLDLLNERNTKELLEYKRGYFDLQEQNKKYKEVFDKLKKLIEEKQEIQSEEAGIYDVFTDYITINDDELLEILEEVE